LAGNLCRRGEGRFEQMKRARKIPIGGRPPGGPACTRWQGWIVGAADAAGAEDVLTEPDFCRSRRDEVALGEA